MELPKRLKKQYNDMFECKKKRNKRGELSGSTSWTISIFG